MTDEIRRLNETILRLIHALDDSRQQYADLWELVRTELDRRSGQTSLDDYCR